MDLLLLGPFKRPSHADPTAEVAAPLRRAIRTPRLSLTCTAQRCHLALCPYFFGYAVFSEAIVTEPTSAKTAIYTRTAEHLLVTDGQHLHQIANHDCDNQNARNQITIAKTPEC